MVTLLIMTCHISLLIFNANIFISPKIRMKLAFEYNTTQVLSFTENFN